MATSDATTTSFDVDMFLSTLTMSYAIEQQSLAEQEAVVIPGTPETIASLPKNKKEKTSKKESAPIVAAAPIVVVQPGTIDAKGFFGAIKAAGKRPNAKGVPTFTNDIIQRQDEHDAVQAYIGWDNKLPHGTNLDKARTEANRSLRNVFRKEYSEYSRSSKPTLTGYVAGMPNETKRRFENLQGRLSKALDDLMEHEAIVNDESLPAGTRQHHTAMVALEKERIQSINIDLRKMGF
jgi:hypothetical protein